MSLWGDIATGLATTAGFALGGPVGAALVGGVVGGLIAGAENGWDMDAIAQGAAVGAVGGLLTMVGGGFGATAVRGALGAKASLAMASPAQLMEQGLFKGFIPRAVGGIHVAPGKLYSAMATPMIAPLVSGATSLVLPQGRGAIPVIDISLAQFPEKMPRVMMPDPAKLPDGLALSPAVVEHYRNLPHLYLANWESFGTEPKEPPPKAWTVPSITAEERADIPNYTQRVEQLTALYERMRANDDQLSEAVGRVREKAAAGQELVGSRVELLSGMAEVHPADTATIDSLVDKKVLQPVPPPTGGPVVSEDNYVMTVIESVTHRAEADMRELTEAFRMLATEVQPPETPPGDTSEPGPEKKNEAAGDETGSPTGRTEVPGPTGSTGSTDTTVQPVTAAPFADLASAPSPLPGTGELPGSSAPPAATTPASTAAPAATAGPAPGATSGAPVATPVAQQPAAPSSMGTGGLDPMLQQAMLQRAAAERGRGSNRGDRERDRRGAGPAPAARATPAAPAAQTTTAPRPGTAQPVSTSGTAQPQQANAARTASAPATTTAPPAATPAPSGTGLQQFVFRDGRSVLVPEVVAHALAIAVSDHVGTDARAAYQRTAVPLPPQGQPAGLPVDPSELRTGDIAQWLPPEQGGAATVASAATSTAIVVMFDGAPPEVIVAGEPRPLTEVLEREGGPLGVFGGFHRPAGAAAPVDTPAGVPVTISG